MFVLYHALHDYDGGEFSVIAVSRDREKLEERIKELLAHAKIGPKDLWDWLLVGDGSGSTWDRAAGWSCVSVTRMNGELFVDTSWHGTSLRGTNNFAEIMAYITPLSAIMSHLVDKDRFHQIHIFTDSEYTQMTGNRVQSGATPDKNALLWETFRAAKRAGLVLRWHWLPRATHGFNRYADDLSRRSRVMFTELDIRGRMAREERIFPGNI